jgi:ABC-type Fe3+/spermidine/putrescine transport system ATPase subunit
MVFQDPSLFPHLTTVDNIAFGLRALDRARRDARVSELLELVEMRGFADRLPATLSGGQQQRIALARSLAPEPAVLLLDEPFSALDANLRTQLRGDVARIVREVGVTTVFVTHDQDEAFVMGDTVGVIREGRLRQIGTPDELYSRPVDRWVAEFVGEANLFSANSVDGVATTVLGRVPLSADGSSGRVVVGRVVVMVRPEDVTVGACGTAGIVEHLDFFGHDTRVSIRLDDGAQVLARVRSREGLHHGSLVRVAYAGGPAVSWPTA